MQIALCSDEPYPVHATVRSWLEEHGHHVVPFGSVASGSEVPWALAAESAAEAVARGECDQGVFFCWTGTGISIAANKVALIGQRCAPTRGRLKVPGCGITRTCCACPIAPSPMTSRRRFSPPGLAQSWTAEATQASTTLPLWSRVTGQVDRPRRSA